MSQRNDNRTLYWEDEPRAPKRTTIAIRGDSFWRSVWKGIESSEPAQAVGAGHGDLPLEPPRDYVVDTDRYQRR